MSVSNQETVFSHVGNGVTVDFAYGCQLQSADDLSVFVDDEQVATGFTVNGVGSASGGSVTFSIAPANGAAVRLERIIVLERTTDYQQNGDFLSRVVNPDFDRIWMALQQKRDEIARALLLPRGESDLNQVLPKASSRANKLLSFDDAGRPVAIALAAQSATALQIQLASSSGSSMVGFQQAGTGSAEMTVQAKLRKFIHLSDKGITPAATAAVNTSAMQALIDEVSAAGGGDIAADAGTYNFLQLKPKNGVRILGIIGKTIFKLDNAAATTSHLFAHNANGLDGSLDDFALDGVILDGNVKDAAFVAYGCQRLRFTDVIFRNGGTYGCGLQARPGFSIALPQDDILFTRCGFENNGKDGSSDGLDIKYCTNVHFVACWSGGNTDAGFNIRGDGVTLTGCYSVDDGTGFRLQATDLVASNPSRFVVSGCSAKSATQEGLQVQASVLNATYVEISTFHSSGNATGIEFSGAGKIYGTASSISAVGNTGNGIHVTGDYLGKFVFSGGVVTGNGADGVNTAGKNAIFDALQIIGNTGTGYREEVGADNNYIATNCVISGNGTDIGTRVGSETDDGFLSVRSKQSLRVFPGLSSGLELQTDSGGAHSSLVAVGDAASIDLRMITKGNGDINLYKNGGAQQLAAFREAGSSTVNYPDFVASLTGNGVQIRAAGSDTNIDLEFHTKGTGVVKFGGYAASADAPVSGYITIKDSGGNVRKLAVIT